MKKIIFGIFGLLIVIICSIIFFNNKDNNLVMPKVSEKSFTITDSGTEIEISIKNLNNDKIEIDEISAELFDEQNKKIGIIKNNKKIILDKSENRIIKMKSKEKYPNTAKIKYKVN